MTDTTTDTMALFEINRLRGSIDNLDAIIIYTLTERFKATQQVGKLKAVHDIPSVDPDREARQVARLKKLAVESGLDPDFAEKILRTIVTEAVRHHEIIKGGGDPATD